MATYHRGTIHFTVIRRPISRWALQGDHLFLRGKRFHSQEHPTDRTVSNHTPDEAIQAAAYAQVPRHGFSQQALIAGARDVGYLDISPGLFIDGPFELIRHHLVISRRDMLPHHTDMQRSFRRNGPVTIASKVEALVWQRLMANQGIIHHWQQALSVMAHPKYALISALELAALADTIWCLAGEDSSDESWYTNRTGLSAIYSSTELFMTADTSQGFQDTRSFLHRRLNEASGMNEITLGLRDWVQYNVAAGANILRSIGARI
jgi:ubiquinone biosynthesis protein COQ9